MTVIRTLLIMTILVTAFFVTRMNADRPPDTLAAPLSTIPASLGGWNAAMQEQIDPAVLESLHPSDYLARQYEKRGARLGVFVAYYGAQQGGDGIHSPQHCLPSNGWSIDSREHAQLNVAGNTSEVNRCIIRKGADKLLLYYWYQSKDRIVADEYTGKILLVRDAILGRHRGAAIVRVTVADKAGVDDDPITFASALAGRVQRCFGLPEE